MPAAAVALFLAAIPVFAADERLRIENSGSTGRVTIVLSDERVRTVEINVPGVISGELLTVEAPAPLVHLGGGSFDGDLLLEAAVQRKVRLSSPKIPTVSVLPAPPRFQPMPSAGLNRVFTGVGIVLEPSWLIPDAVVRGCRQPADAKEHRTRSTIASRESVPARPLRSSHAARAMMPRR